MGDPFSVLPQFYLRLGAPATDIAAAQGFTTFRQVADAVWRLPYGRNSDRANPLLVLSEGCGTCSTRHAFLAMLAREAADTELELVLGTYMMSEANTPGVGAVLAPHGLDAIPEAHCFLRAAGERVDLTHPPGALPGEPIANFRYEEVIEPTQIGDYKLAYHRAAIARWLQEADAPSLTLDEAWAIREGCIAALSTVPGPAR